MDGLPGWLRVAIEKLLLPPLEKSAPAAFDLALEWLEEHQRSANSASAAHVYDEIAGIARGTCRRAGCDESKLRAQIARLNVLPELVRMLCSMLGAWGEATGGPLIQMRTLDFGGGPFANASILLVHHPDKGGPFASLGFPSFAGVVTGFSPTLGLSEKVNFLSGQHPDTPPGSYGGRSVAYTIREMVAAATADEAAQVARDAERTWGVWLGIGDARAGRLEVIDYQRASVRAYNQSTMPSRSGQPLIKDTVYLDKHAQPSRDTTLPTLVAGLHGNLSARRVAQQIPRGTASGDVHIGVYDFTPGSETVLVATGTSSSNGSYAGGRPAHAAPFLLFEMAALSAPAALVEASRPAADALLEPAPSPQADPLSAYVSAPEKVFAWRDTGVRVKPLLVGGLAYVLNVTSLKWLDDSQVRGPNGATWTHQVAVVVPDMSDVPDRLAAPNVSLTYLTGGCNKAPVSPPSGDDEELLVVATAAKRTGTIGVLVYQLPNCPLVFSTDPARRERGEDALLAWAWRDFMADYDPQRLPRLPMVKGAMQCMRAVEQFTAQQGLAQIQGHFVAGASKRGWTTWMVGAAECATCPRILGLAPLVPIVPDIRAEVHRQWRSYGGFTFAFSDYTDANITQLVDSDGFARLQRAVDPKYYAARLARLPKLVVDSSDDEFMQFDWTTIWREQFEASTRLLVVPNSEHSLSTGIPALLPALVATVDAVAHGRPMPSFSSSYDAATGAIVLTIPPGARHGKVVLRHAQTISTERRDFRWVRLAHPTADPCKLPDVPLRKPLFGGNCLQPIVWHGATLAPVSAATPNVFKAVPPEPKEGHWTGYYVEVFFDEPKGTFQFTTPGYVWPDTLPFPDCHGATCAGRLV